MFDVTIDISPGGGGRERMRAFSARYRAALVAGLDEANETVLARAQRKRFRGRGPFPVGDHRLGVRSGRLRQSLRTRKATDDGKEIVSGVECEILRRA